MRRSLAALAALAIASGIAFAAVDARAQGTPDTAHAKEAYDRGVAAHEKGDFLRAAREFAAADSLAPSSVALQAALDAAVDADDAVIGGELLERSKRLAAPINPKLARSIDAARKKLGGRAGRVHVTCPVGATCTATLDGKPFETKSPAWVVIGPHTVVVQVDGETQSKGVDVKGDELVDFAPVRKAAVAPAPPASPPPTPLPAGTTAAPPAPPTPPPADTTSASSGLPPLVFYVTLGATVVAAATAGYFMLTTKSKHDDFVRDGCEAAPGATCDGLKKDGDFAQTAANVTIVVTAALTVATVVLGAAFTDWKATPRSALRLHGPGSGSQGSGASYLLRF